MKAERLDGRATERLMDDTDSQRRRYHREHYGRDWDDPVHYHMVLNTGLAGPRWRGRRDHGGGAAPGLVVCQSSVILHHPAPCESGARRHRSS